MSSSTTNNQRPTANSGQAMILAVLTLGGAILGVTAVAGLLMLYQIRQSTDFQNSAKAIFAADSGVEWALYSYFQPPQGSLPNFLNNSPVPVSVTVSCYDDSNNLLLPDPNCSTASSSYAISEGMAGGTKRAFLIELTGATSTFP